MLLVLLVLLVQALDVRLADVMQDGIRACVLVTSEFRAHGDKVQLTLRKGVTPAYTTKRAAMVCKSTSYKFAVKFWPSKAWKCGLAERTQRVVSVFRLSDAASHAALGPQAALEVLLTRGGCEASDIALLTKLMDDG